MTLHTLLLLAALSSPGETVLLEFTTAGCAPCRSMQPVVQRLQREGFSIRQVNITANRQLASRFRVYQVPCFVMVIDGREVDRVVGATTYDRLVSMMRAGNRQAASLVALPAGPPAGSNHLSLPPSPALPVPASVRPTSALTRTSPQRALQGVQQRALNATVRLRVEDPRGTSYGTGTVINRHGNEALVLTCGHIFRDSQGSGTIQVDLFVNGSTRSVPGELISYDAQRDDVGLVTIRPGVDIQPVPVAAATTNVAGGQQVFAIGCNRGAGPTVLSSKIMGVNRFVGSPNYTVQGRPHDGRSGGGLFTEDGQLIGLCKWAVTDADEGVYAGLLAVHNQFSHAGLQSLFDPVAAGNSPGMPVDVPSGVAPTERMQKGLSTLPAAPSPALGQGVAVTVDPGSTRQAEYEAKLQALERAYEISRETLQREYQRSPPMAVGVEVPNR